MALQATEMLLCDGTCVLLLREYPQWLTETFVQPGREIFFGKYVVDEVTFQLRGAPVTDDMVQMLEDIGAEGWRR